MCYPNPAQDRIIFQLPTGERVLNVEVIDVLGAVHQLIANGNSIATDALAPGAYTARIRTSDEAYTSRFVKQ